MLAGRRPAPCRGCYMYEDLGTESDRQILNRIYDHYIPDAIAHSSEDGCSQASIRTVDIRLGNQCNLRCRMCSPRVSRALLDEFTKLHRIPEHGAYVQAVQNMDWFESDDFFAIFEQSAAEMEELHFAGGEPLLIHRMFDILRTLIELGRAGKIGLSYISNLTVIPKDLYELWPEFRTVQIAASLDGQGQVNSFIRFPANWEQLEANLKTLDRDANHLNCSHLKFNTTVQIYNIFSLPALFEYIFDTFQNFEPFPNLIILRQPTCFSIQTLPPELKTEAISRLRAFIPQHERTWRSRAKDNQVEAFRSKVEAIIRHMESTDRSREIPEFVRRSEFHDRYRGQRAAEIVPELAGLLREGGKVS
jgi:hypothetical protein